MIQKSFLRQDGRRHGHENKRQWASNLDLALANSQKAKQRLESHWLRLAANNNNLPIFDFWPISKALEIFKIIELANIIGIAKILKFKIMFANPKLDINNNKSK